MGAQEWPVGQLAVATVRGAWRGRVMLGLDGEWFSTGPVGGYWAHPHEYVTDVRPLVVLDLDAWWSSLSDRSGSPAGWLRVVADCAVRSDGFPHNSSPNVRLVRWIADQIEAQTRPPKPAEPTGLGAVVVDREGVVWQLADDMKGAANWRRTPERGHRPDERNWRKYVDIDVERVAFEGIIDDRYGS